MLLYDVDFSLADKLLINKPLVSGDNLPLTSDEWREISDEWREISDE